MKLVWLSLVGLASATISFATASDEQSQRERPIAAKLEDHETRLSKLEARIADYERRLKALEAPAKTTGIPETIQARRFELMDKTGKVRGVLGMRSTSVALSIGGQHTNANVTLAVFPDGEAGLNIIGRDGETGLLLTAAADGSASLSIHDSAGIPRANVGLAKDGSPQVLLLGLDEGAVFSLP
ncbi:MAG: hypothetical protein ACYSUI_19065 [Planctomycetota bacterium]